MRRWRRLGVRGRLTAFATAVVLLAAAVGGTLLVLVLRWDLAVTASSDARARVAEVAASVEADGIDAVAARLALGTPAGQYVQLLGPDGTVRAASDGRVAGRPLSRQRPAPGVTESVRLDTDDLGRTDDWVVAARGLTVDGQAHVVQAAVPAAAQRQAVAAVAVLVAVAAPVLVLLVAGATWLLVGRALRPVEQLCAVVATIDAPWHPNV